MALPPLIARNPLDNSGAFCSPSQEICVDFGLSEPTQGNGFQLSNESLNLDPKRLKNTSGGLVPLERSQEEYCLQFEKSTDPEERLRLAMGQAQMAAAVYDDTSYAFWKKKAFLEIEAMPANTQAMMRLMTEAQFFVFEGNPGAAFDSLDILRGIFLSHPEALESLVSMRAIESHQIMLAASAAAEAVLKYDIATAKTHPPSQSQIKWQERAMRYADKLYALQPKETSLESLFGIYRQVGMDPKSLRARITFNEQIILTTNDMDCQVGHHHEWEQLSENGKKGGLVLAARAENARLKPLLKTIEGRLLGLVEKVPRVSGIETEIQKATAYRFMGLDDEAIVSFQNVVMANGHLFETPETLQQAIGALHQIADMAENRYRIRKKALDTSEDLILKLALTHPKTALLLKTEHKKLAVAFAISTMDQKYRNGEINEEQYYLEISYEYRTAALTLELALEAYLHDPEVSEISNEGIAEEALRSFLAHALLSFRVKNVEPSLALLPEEVSSNAQRFIHPHLVADQDDALRRYRKSEANYGSYLAFQALADIRAEVEFAIANHELKHGKIAASLERIEKLTREYPLTSTVHAMTMPGMWTREKQVVDVNGRFVANGQDPSFVEGLKVYAAQLVSNPGRAMLACITGMVALAFARGQARIAVDQGLVACSVILSAERSLTLVQGHRDRIAAYRSGVSSITAEKLALSSSLFAFNLLSIYLGGSVGGFLEKAIGVVGERVGLELTTSLLEMGVTPGPWMRGIGSAALWAAKTSGNAIAFHETSSRVMQPLMGKHEEDKGAAYLGAWLFVTMMPLMKKMNPGQWVIAGEKTASTLWAREAVNTVGAAFSVQLAQALGSGDFNAFFNKVAKLSVELPMMHQGSKAFATVIPLRTIQRLGMVFDIDAKISAAKTKQLLEEGLPPDPWGDGGFMPGYATAEGGHRTLASGRDPRLRPILMSETKTDPPWRERPMDDDFTPEDPTSATTAHATEAHATKPKASWLHLATDRIFDHLLKRELAHVYWTWMEEIQKPEQYSRVFDKNTFTILINLKRKFFHDPALWPVIERAAVLLSRDTFLFEFDPVLLKSFVSQTCEALRMARNSKSLSQKSVYQRDRDLINLAKILGTLRSDLEHDKIKPVIPFRASGAAPSPSVVAESQAPSKPPVLARTPTPSSEKKAPKVEPVQPVPAKVPRPVPPRRKSSPKPVPPPEPSSVVVSVTVTAATPVPNVSSVPPLPSIIPEVTQTQIEAIKGLREANLVGIFLDCCSMNSLYRITPDIFYKKLAQTTALIIDLWIRRKNGRDFEGDMWGEADFSMDHPLAIAFKRLNQFMDRGVTPMSLKIKIAEALKEGIENPEHMKSFLGLFVDPKLHDRQIESIIQRQRKWKKDYGYRVKEVDLFDLFRRAEVGELKDIVGAQAEIEFVEGLLKAERYKIESIPRLSGGSCDFRVIDTRDQMARLVEVKYIGRDTPDTKPFGQRVGSVLAKAASQLRNTAHWAGDDRISKSIFVVVHGGMARSIHRATSHRLIDDLNAAAESVLQNLSVQSITFYVSQTIGNGKDGILEPILLK